MTYTKHGFFVTLKWRGATNTRPCRIAANWRGWSSDDHKTVWRSITHDYERQHADYVQWAINEFMQWLNTTGTLPGRVPGTVVTVDLGNGVTGIAITTRFAGEAK